MILCQLNQVKKEYSGTTIFEELTFTIKENDRIGLVGRNGSGKTTLFNLISGREEADEGIVTKPKECDIGSLSQIPTADGDLLGRTFIESAFKELISIKTQMKKLEEQLSSEQNEARLSQLVEQYGRLQEEFEQRRGYEMESKIASVVKGLQIEELVERTFKEMSGGEKTKMGLALILLQQPTVLLLDEPTNHLDLESIEWLEGFIKDYPGSISPKIIFNNVVFPAPFRPTIAKRSR